MDIAEFLLARIAEDERSARDVHQDGCESLLCSECTVGPFPCDCGRPGRALAECEVKRRIVEAWTGPGRDPSWADGYADAINDVVRDLALPYADHPDYQPEWFPLARA